MATTWQALSRQEGPPGPPSGWKFTLQTLRSATPKAHPHVQSRKEPPVLSYGVPVRVKLIPHALSRPSEQYTVTGNSHFLQQMTQTQTQTRTCQMASPSPVFGGCSSALRISLSAVSIMVAVFHQ